MKRKCFLTLSLLCVSIVVMAESNNKSMEPSMTFGLSGLGLANVELFGGFKGLEIIPGVESRFLLYTGGGYYGDSYWRDAAGTKLPYDSKDAMFNKWAVNARLGLELGILYSGWVKRNSLTANFFVKTLYNNNIKKDGKNESIFASGVPGAEGFWKSSLFTGLDFNLVSYDRFTQSYYGAGIKGSVEWTPGLAFNRLYGEADYYRLNTELKGFLPLWRNSTSAFYIADRFTADYLGGGLIPSYAQRTLGGLYQEFGAGGFIRGIPVGSNDADVKLLNNFELRMTFPTFIGYVLIPELFTFFDTGLVDNKDYKLKAIGDALYTLGGGLKTHLYYSIPGIIDLKLTLGYYVTYDVRNRRWNFLNFIIGTNHF